MIICDLFRVGTVGLMAIPSLPFAALCVLLFCTVLTGVPFSSARAALMPDVLPGAGFVLGSAIGNVTYQASQILGFVAGAAVVAVLDPHRTMGIDAMTFGLSALIVLTGVRSRPAPGRARPANPGTAERAGEPWPRRLGAPLADEALRDGTAVAALFRDHDPGDQVDQDAGPAEDREHGERQTDQGRVDAEVGRYAAADSGDDIPLARPVQALAWVDVWLSHR